MASLITIPDGKDQKQYIKVGGHLDFQIRISPFLQVYDLLEQIEVCCIDVSAQKKHGKIHPSG